MAVLNVTHMQVVRSTHHLPFIAQRKRNERLTGAILDRLPSDARHGEPLHRPDASFVPVPDLDALNEWWLALPVLGVTGLRTTIEAVDLWDGIAQMWSVHVTAPDLYDGQPARLVAHALSPLRETVPEILEEAVAA